MDSEGLYRISGAKASIDELRRALDAGGARGAAAGVWARLWSAGLSNSMNGRCTGCDMRHAGMAEVVDMSSKMCSDVNTLTGTLKLYLRELPDRLFTTEARAAWLSASRTDCSLARGGGGGRHGKG